jgi:hypothetical protein
MVTNCPHLTAHQGLRTTAHRARTGGFSRLMTVMSQMFCGLKGHDTMLRFEEERMSLRCVSCGHETPGWELNEAPPTVTARSDSRRHTLARRQLISTRRIA